MQHPSATAVGMQVKNDPPCQARGRTGMRSASSRKTACGPEPRLTGTRFWLCSSFRFLWTAQLQIYATAGRVRNQNPATPKQNRKRTVDIVEHHRKATGTTDSVNSAPGKSLQSA
jgi:hypothetical protein